MKVGILGSGDVGKSLAEGFLKHGHDVTVGSRDPGKLAEWNKKNPKAKVGTFDQTAKYGELVVLAVNGNVADQALQLAGAANLAGKPVIDACNPTANVPPVNGVLTLFTDSTMSLMEKLQKQFPAANFVKAFNTIGHNLMVNPKFKDGKPTMFFCGNNESAKKAVVSILEEFGWEPFDAGKVEAARAIEPLCVLWIVPGLIRNEWNHAYKMLRA